MVYWDAESIYEVCESIRGRDHPIRCRWGIMGEGADEFSTQNTTIKDM